jgi:hypothetical protein
MKAKYPEYKGLNLPNIATAVLEKWQKEANRMKRKYQKETDLRKKSIYLHLRINILKGIDDLNNFIKF